jgi:hypothetical protein
MHLHMPSEARRQEDCGINAVLLTGITVSSHRTGGTISYGILKRGAIGLDFNLNRLQGKMKRCFFEANEK